MTKRISIAQLKPGMFIVGLDKSWWQTPFLSHKWTVQGQEDIAKLASIGVREVDIDLTQGHDVESPPPSPASSSNSPFTEETPQKNCTEPDSVTVLVSSPPILPSSAVTKIAADLPVARAARNKAVAILEGIFEGVKIGKPINSPVVKHAVSGLLESILHRSEASLMLTQMQRFETDLLAHAIDVCVLSLVIGKQQELSMEQLETLGVGAILHDVGKTRLPRNLLRQSDGCSPQAQKLLNEHPRLGYLLLSHDRNIPTEALRIVAEHHERADGSGFPEKRTAANLSSLGQIVNIVNVYDELVSGYGGPAHLPTQALRRLYKMGTEGAFLSDQVTWTIRALGIYPVGSVVELNTEERGLVIATNSADAQKPVVLVVCGADGQPFAAPRLVNLMARTTEEPVVCITHPLPITAIPGSLLDYFKDTL